MKTIISSFRIDPELKKSVDKINEVRGRTMNGVITSLLEKYVTENIKYLK